MQFGCVFILLGGATVWVSQEDLVLWRLSEILRYFMPMNLYYLFIGRSLLTLCGGYFTNPLYNLIFLVKLLDSNSEEPAFSLGLCRVLLK